jgi:hypothetical protein
MTWPEQYVPVHAAHWVADRQSGPNLLRCGTEEQRTSILPRTASGGVLLRDRDE